MLLLSRNYVFRVYPINRDYSGPSERVRLVTCRLTCDYPTKEFHHYCTYTCNVTNELITNQTNKLTNKFTFLKGFLILPISKFEVLQQLLNFHILL